MNKEEHSEYFIEVYLSSELQDKFEVICNNNNNNYLKYGNVSKHLNLNTQVCLWVFVERKIKQKKNIKLIFNLHYVHNSLNDLFFLRIKSCAHVN